MGGGGGRDMAHPKILEWHSLCTRPTTTLLLVPEACDLVGGSVM